MIPLTLPKVALHFNDYLELQLFAMGEDPSCNGDQVIVRDSEATHYSILMMQRNHNNDLDAPDIVIEIDDLTDFTVATEFADHIGNRYGIDFEFISA